MRKKIIFLIALYCILTAVEAATTSTGPTNIIVDFSTSGISTLHVGDSGVLNLVIENTGGYRADNLEVYVPSSQVVDGEKRFYVGTVSTGQSKILLVPLKVSNKATPGLKTIQVVIDYDGFDADGDRDNNKQTKWEIPVTVYGSPNFEADLEKTTYYKDTLDKLTIKGYTRDTVKDLTATLSSTCVTFIGSSRKYVGELPADQHFEVSFDVKPTAAGACQTTLTLSYKDTSGASASDTISLGLNVESAGVDFKVLNVSYEPTGPGEKVGVGIKLKNVGKADAEEVTVSLTLDTPFVPVDTTERYLGTVSGGENIETEFDLSVGLDGEIKPYTIPLNISYKVGGSSYSVKKDIGVDVTGRVILEIINIDTSRGLQIDVANIGTRTAEGVKAILNVEAGGNATLAAARQQAAAGTAQNAASRQMPAQNPLQMLTGRGGPTQRQQTQQTTNAASSVQAGSSQMLIEYKSNIKPTAQSTFTFDTTLSGPATLTLEYTGLNGERVTQTERINAGSSIYSASGVVASSFSRQSSQSNNRKYAIYGFVAVIILWIVYRKRKGQKILPEALKSKLKRK